MKTKTLTISCIIACLMFLFTNTYADDTIYIDSEYDIFVNNKQISDGKVYALESSYNDKVFVPLEPFFLLLDCIVEYCPNKYVTPVFDVFTPSGELIRLSENPNNLNIGAPLQYHESYLYTESTREFYGSAVFWRDSTAYIALQDLSKIYSMDIAYDDNKITIQKDYIQQDAFIKELKNYVNSKSYIGENCVDYLRMKNSNPEKPFDEIIPDVNKKTSDDVGCSNWALKDIIVMSEENILPAEMRNGYTKKINRYDFSIIAYNLLKTTGNISYRYEDVSFFHDTKSMEINYLFNIGIINGKSETEFAPYDELTREEAAIIISRMANYLDISVEANDSFRYGDDYNISNWAKDSVYLMRQLNIMTGTNNDFYPRSICTKEQAITAIMRLYNILNQK